MKGKNQSSSIVIRWRGLLVASLIAVSIQPAAAAVDSIRLILPAQADAVLGNLGKVFERQIGDRCGARVIVNGDAPLTVELAVETGIGTEGYRIEDRPGGGVRIVGNDARGVVAGSGKFLRGSRYDQGGFTAGGWRGASVPQKPHRGIYFATHFHSVPSRGAKQQDDPGAEKAYATMRKVDKTLPPQARKSWRWRQLYLRALLDSELKTNGGRPNDLCNEAFAELIEIYHAENAIGTVRPPLPKGWKPSSDSPSESVGGEDDVGDPSEPWAYLDNGTIRIGVDKSRGAAIGCLALSSTQRNLLNHHDEGRFIQQSYYGDPDGSLWAKNPWVYNPVQGGSYKGEDARTLEFRKSRDELYAKVEPLHWASAKRCPEAIMEEWITLDGPIARIRMRMEYSGPTQQRNAHQELPAMFVDFALPHLMFELDGQLVKHAPAMLGTNLKPENIRYDTEWLAFVDDDGFGIGIHTPGADQAVTYRHRGNGTTGPDGSACSYVAPVRTMQLKNGTVVDYHFHLTIGTLDEIRRRFGKLAAKSDPKR